MKIVVAKVPGVQQEVNCENGLSVGQILNMATSVGDVSGYEYRLDGEKVEGTKAVHDNGSLRHLLLTVQSKGNDNVSPLHMEMEWLHG